MSDFQNVRDGKPFPPVAARVPSIDEDAPTKKARPRRPAAMKATTKNSAAKTAAASTTTSGESASTSQGESA